MCRASRVFSIAVGLLGLASCVMTEQPLSDGESSRVDERLVGAWREVVPPGEPREGATLEFGRAEDEKNAMRIVRRVANEDPRTYTTYVRPGNPPVLSIGLEDDAGKVSWLPMRYALDEHGDLKLAGLDRKLFCPAVAEGKLRGAANKNDAGECVSVTLAAPPDDVLKFIEQHPDAAWAEPVTYRRVEQ
ncbi:MAG: hypothetical protein WED34_19080 [Planctomycetales bacterium]